MMYLLYFIGFLYNQTYRWYLQKISNFLVNLHIYFTPYKSTEDSFREMILDHIRYRQRLIEQKRWKLWRKMIYYKCKIDGLEFNNESYNSIEIASLTEKEKENG